MEITVRCEDDTAAAAAVSQPVTTKFVYLQDEGSTRALGVLMSLGT